MFLYVFTVPVGRAECIDDKRQQYIERAAFDDDAIDSGPNLTF